MPVAESIDYRSLTYPELKSHAKDRGVSIRHKKKDVLISDLEKIEELLDTPLENRNDPDYGVTQQTAKGPDNPSNTMLWLDYPGPGHSEWHCAKQETNDVVHIWDTRFRPPARVATTYRIGPKLDKGDRMLLPMRQNAIDIVDDYNEREQ